MIKHIANRDSMPLPNQASVAANAAFAAEAYGIACVSILAGMAGLEQNQVEEIIHMSLEGVKAKYGVK